MEPQSAQATCCVPEAALVSSTELSHLRVIIFQGAAFQGFARGKL